MAATVKFLLSTSKPKWRTVRSVYTTTMHWAKRDKAAEQLSDYKQNHPEGCVLTTSSGSPVGKKTASLSVGPRGPLLLHDFVFIDEMAHLTRERIPERVVHAKGAGAFGHFEVTHDITNYCKAKVFEKVGHTTDVAVRFATTHGEKGSADTLRDARGFSVKFYTEDGNWDLVGLHLPIFFISDPIMFPSLVHSQKRNPVTNLEDADMFWDFVTLRHETVNMVMRVFSDYGTPDGYRFMNGYGCNAFKMVNAGGKVVYCKFHFKPDCGIKNLTAEEAKKLQAEDPNYATRDLYNAIARGDCPSWSLSIQVMRLQEAEALSWNPFDVTKEWSKEDYPPLPVGRLTLNKNPKNYFTDVEQIAFSVSHMVPGIEPSPDKTLQGRMFAYPDAQRHRLGVNYLQIPVNCPFKVSNYERSGPQCVTDNQGGAPNYYPNSFNGPVDNPKYLAPAYQVSGDVKRYDTEPSDNYSQAGDFYKGLSSGGKENLITNVAEHLKNAQVDLQIRAIELFTKVDSEFGAKLENALAYYKDTTA